MPLRHLLDFDPETGVLKAQAGVTLDDVIRFALPRGWFPPVTPGTRLCTLGGCVAADVHGKNHHRVGAFGAFVDELEMVLADGDVVRCSRTERSGPVLVDFGRHGADRADPRGHPAAGAGALRLHRQPRRAHRQPGRDLPAPEGDPG